MISIKSRKAGFRRCGIAHPAAWTDYPDGAFTPAEIAVFQDEPMLQVVVVDPEAGPDMTAVTIATTLSEPVKVDPIAKEPVKKAGSNRPGTRAKR